MTCHFTPKKRCENNRSCDSCRVPNSFGYFWVQKGAKGEWEQRFILEKSRAAILAGIDREIEKLQKERLAVVALPGR